LGALPLFFEERPGGRGPVDRLDLAVPRPEPLEILGERFARGDIILDESETAKRALGYPSSPTPPSSDPRHTSDKLAHAAIAGRRARARRERFWGQSKGSTDRTGANPDPTR
jgi:hypothetical protein